MYKIISDGGIDFSKEEVIKHGIGVVPFYITFDGETFLKEGKDITRDEYFNRLINEKNLYPKTSQPSPQDYIDMYTPYLKAGLDIISLTISSKLSGSHASAALAADMLKDDFPKRTIAIIDSLNVSVGQGLIMREMIKMRDAGLSLQETVKMAEKVRASAKVYFTLDSLEYLKRGGRIGPTTAFVGGILGLRPILQLSEGQITQLDSVRGKARALKLMEEAIVDTLKNEIDNLSISVGHIRSEAEAISIKSTTETALNTRITNPITDIGVTVGTHAGPGALGFAYCRKYESFTQLRKVA